MNWKTFFICGLTGWCMEILFTSLGGLLRGDLLLNGHTSIWMFPIYGLAAVIGPLSVRLRHWPVLLRGCFYGDRIVEKKELKLPKQVKNVIKCKNPRCVTSIEQELDQIFILADEEKEVYRCKYCEEKYTNPNRRQIKVM